MRFGDASMAPPRAVARRSRSLFFPGAALVMLAIMFAGFAPSFYLRFAFVASPLPVHVIIHGLIMTAWQGLYAVQAWLAHAGRISQHRRLGWLGCALAVLAFVSSIQAALLQPARLAAAGTEVPGGITLLVVSSLFGRVSFAVLVGLAIHWRRERAIHARLMYWAALISAAPALAGTRRLGEMLMPVFPTSFPPQLALIWLGWIAILAHDWHEDHRFHPASVIPPIVMLFAVWSVEDWVVLLPTVKAFVEG